jgi:hypothetical protein
MYTCIHYQAIGSNRFFEMEAEKCKAKKIKDLCEDKK